MSSTAPSSTTSPTTRANIQNTLSSFISSHNSISIDAILAPRHPTCTHQIIPLSHGRAPRTNDQYREFVESSLARGLFQDLKFEADNTIIDAEARKASLHAWIDMSTPLGPFRSEYAFFVWFDETGEWIMRIEEFVDTKYTGEFFERLMAVGANEEEEEGA